MAIPNGKRPPEFGDNGVPPSAKLPPRMSASPAASPAPQPVAATAETHAAALQALQTQLQQNKFAQVFSQSVAVLMRDPAHKNLPLKDLEMLLLPPILANQCAVANTKGSVEGAVQPLALVLWARVSPDIDKRIAGNLDHGAKLVGNEWTSGNTIWITTLAGAHSALMHMLKQLCARDWKDQTVKMTVTGQDGKRSVAVLNRAKT